MKNPSRDRVSALAVLLGLLGCAAHDAPAQTRYDILVTNDDGIGSPGIADLARALSSAGAVTVVAPCGQRSGSSMAVSLGQELQLRTVDMPGVGTGYCADTTPAGAVLLAIASLAPADGFDLVVSGINAGANVGDVAHMSGTVGAAMMGAFHGIPAVAASLGGTARDFGYAAAFVGGFVEDLKEHAPLPGVVLSVNIPAETQGEITGVTVAPMGGSYIRVGYSEVESESGARLFRPEFGSPDPFPAGSDSEAYTAGAITVTPLRFDWTAHDVIDELRSWSLSHEVAAPGG